MFERSNLVERLLRARSAVAFALGRSGFLLPLVSRSIWFHGEDIEAFESAVKLIALVRRRVAGHRILLTSSQRAVYEWLARRFPNDAVAPAPRDDPFSASRFLGEMQPSTIVCVGNADGLGRRVRAKASRLGIPMALVSFAGHGEQVPALRVLPFSHARVPGADTADLQREAGFSEQIRVTGDLSRETESQRVFEDLKPFLPQLSERRPYDRGWWQKGFVPRLSRSSLGTAAAEILGQKRIESFEVLKKRLGNPQTILCLGNGPSSEDPRLSELQYDCLFRTNWHWKRRGMLDHPQFVFVGSFQTTLEVSDCIFGFRDIESERVVLLRNLKRPWRKPIELFTVERVPTLLDDLQLTARPTSGVLMILVAAALQPQELIIAGMDLFAHPAGRYPGESLVENDYAQPHDRDVELMLIRRILGEYRGKVRILSEVLLRELESPRVD